MKQQKEKKPNVTKRKLKAAGYRYKLEEQKKEQREGVKITNPKTGKVETYDPPDYNYYYRQIGDAQVKLFKIGDRFYYKNNWLRYMEQLPLIEEDAKAEGVIDKEGNYPLDNPDWKVCPNCGGDGTFELQSLQGAYPGVDCKECETFYKRFKHLWTSINGSESWDTNPFCWVISFERIDKPE